MNFQNQQVENEPNFGGHQDHQHFQEDDDGQYENGMAEATPMKRKRKRQKSQPEDHEYVQEPAYTVHPQARSPGNQNNTQYIESQQLHQHYESTGKRNPGLISNEKKQKQRQN